jgi:hypothetical protein
VAVDSPDASATSRNVVRRRRCGTAETYRHRP